MPYKKQKKMLEIGRAIKAGISGPELVGSNMKNSIEGALVKFENDCDYPKFRQRMGGINSKFGKENVKRLLMLR